MIISIYAQHLFTNATLIHVNNFKYIKSRGELQPKKEYLQKPRVYIILKGGKFEAFLLGSGTVR